MLGFRLGFLLFSLLVAGGAQAEALSPLPGLIPTCREERAEPAPASPFSRKNFARVNRVAVYETTVQGSHVRALEPKPSLTLLAPGELSKTDGKLFTFNIDPRAVRQRMIGFGAAFTESCTMQLVQLPAPMRAEFLQKMFSKTAGAGFDAMRLPMGATDFSDPVRGNYTYDDSPNNEPDPEFRYFDMSRDEPTFALIREARRINPNLKVMVSPWSPPAWMKTSRSINGGSLKPEHFQDYANYFVRVIQEYEKHGVPVDSLTIQNEPYFAWEGVPSAEMATDAQAKFIGQYLGPTLERHGIRKGIFAHDHNWSGAKETNQIINDLRAGKYIGGAAFHCYGGNYYNMLDVMRPNPGLPILQTECSAIDDRETTTEQAFLKWSDMQALGAIRMGASGAIAWNLCLNEKYGPNNWAPGKSGCANCRGLATVDMSGKAPEVRYEPEYYALAQVSRFIDPSFRHIPTEDEWQSKTVKMAPFANDQGAVVVAMQNEENRAVNVRVRLADCRSFVYKIPARAAVTFTLAPDTPYSRR